jgi:hypothetical protein
MKAWHACQPPVRDALSSGRIIRNHFLKIVACILWGWSSSLLYAATDEIGGGETNLVGTTEGILSHRFQKHSWITPDGRFHVMINTGPTEDALHLSSSSDGFAWDLQSAIPDTDRSSHPDGTLAGNRLYIAYPTRTKQVALSVYDYQPGENSWVFVERIAIPGDRRTSYERPSVARDALGRIWISAIGVKGNVKTIFLYVIESANTPRRVNRRFGLSNRYHQRSARLLQFRGGVMMVFSDDPAKNNQEYTLNFTQRLDTQPLGAAWTPAKQILHYHDEPDDNGAHFSCAVDSLGAVHIVTRSNRTMYYLKLANGDLAARTPRDLKLVGPRQYPQAAVSESGTVHLFCPVEQNGREIVHVLSSSDGGESFQNDYDLIFRPDEHLGDRRLEAPSNFSETLPVLMLYEQYRLAGFIFDPSSNP